MIKKIYKQFKEEIESGYDYNHCALEYDGKDDYLEKMYADMAAAEVNHATKLHAAVKRHANSEGVDPAAVQMILEIMADELIKLKAMIAASE